MKKKFLGKVLKEKVELFECPGSGEGKIIRDVIKDQRKCGRYKKEVNSKLCRYTLCFRHKDIEDGALYLICSKPQIDTFLLPLFFTEE